MSAATATLIAGGLAILGTLLGLVVERLLRSTGRLRCEVSGWETRFTAELNQFGEFQEIKPAEARMFAKRVEYRFAIDLFNGKEIPTGLRDISVVLVCDDGKRFTSQPYDLASVQRDPSFDMWTRNDVYVVNIPPRQFVRIEIAGSFGREGVVALATGKWKRVKFEAQRPKRPLLWRKTYRKTIIEP